MHLFLIRGLVAIAWAALFAVRFGGDRGSQRRPPGSAM